MASPDYDIASEHLAKWLEALYQLADRLATLSAAALALTVTFRKDLAGDGLEYVWALKASWLAFILAIIGFILVYLGRISIHRRAVIAARNPVLEVEIVLPPWYFRLGRLLLLTGFLAGMMLLASIGIINW